MLQTKVQVQERNEIGKNKVDKLRAEKFLPGVVYSKGGDNVHIKINEPDFLQAFKVAGTSSVLGLELEGKEIPVIIKEVQKHPFKNQIVHIDFQKVNMDEKVKMTIPIVILNRDSIKTQPSVLVQQLDEIEIECLPGNIPGSIECDVADLGFDEPITVGDLDIAKNDKIIIHRELDDVICSLSHPTIETEEEDEVDQDQEPELVGESEEDQE